MGRTIMVRSREAAHQSGALIFINLPELPVFQGNQQRFSGNVKLAR
jgi:hypothetical protein